MTEHLNRRYFMGASLAASAALLAKSAPADEPAANDKLVVGVMGTGGRGTEHAKSFAQQPGVTVAYVCDVDQKRANAAAGVVEKLSGKAPKATQDFRHILDDKAVNILVVATCNHWHAPATILACNADKHVYVEKPCSHNAQEGEWMVTAAHKNKKLVQMGNQRRSWPKIIEAMEQVRNGIIGRAYLAQSWYANLRQSIGHGKEAPVPEGLDYDLWQGPAPRKAFRSNYLHYNWHWFWHWGNGELGNNGIHMLDLCRWGLGVDFPIHVGSSGGRYRYEDDQETPDTHTVAFDFADRKTITWTGFSCNNPPAGKGAEVIFHGENGSLMIGGNGYTVHDPKGKEIQKVTGEGGDAVHIRNFLDAIRAGKPLNSEIEGGHKSTLLCHLGNIAHRTGRALRCDPKTGHVLGDKDAAALWGREYEKGWEPKV
ncbi:MAG: Gfo/Idh/MocA family protein [Gemmataceae bacterium]